MHSLSNSISYDWILSRDQEKERKLIANARKDFENAIKEVEGSDLPYNIVEKEGRVIGKCTGRLIIFMEGYKEGIEGADNPAKTLDPSKKDKEVEELAQHEASKRLKAPMYDIAILMDEFKKTTEHQRELKNRIIKVQAILSVIRRDLGSVNIKLETKEHTSFNEYKANFNDSSSLDQYNKWAEKVKSFDFSKAKTESAELKKRRSFKAAEEEVDKNLKALKKLLALPRRS